MSVREALDKIASDREKLRLENEPRVLDLLANLREGDLLTLFDNRPKDHGFIARVDLVDRGKRTVTTTIVRDGNCGSTNAQGARQIFDEEWLGRLKKIDGERFGWPE